MAWTQALIDLQDVDHQLLENHKQLREIEAQLRDTAELARAEAAAKAREEEAKAARRQQETLEFELSQVQVKRELTEKNLYGGRITNARELQDLQAEQQSLKRRISTLEDQLLEAMIAREEADEAATDASERLERLRTATEREQETLIQEREQLREANEVLREERERLRAQLPASILDSYEYLWDRTGGMPVARLKGDTCSICGTVALRPTHQKVQRGQEAYCDSCGRLLVG